MSVYIYLGYVNIKIDNLSTIYANNNKLSEHIIYIENYKASGLKLEARFRYGQLLEIGQMVPRLRRSIIGSIFKYKT